MGCKTVMVRHLNIIRNALLTVASGSSGTPGFLTEEGSRRKVDRLKEAVLARTRKGLGGRAGGGGGGGGGGEGEGGPSNGEDGGEEEAEGGEGDEVGVEGMREAQGGEEGIGEE